MATPFPKRALFVAMACAALCFAGAASAQTAPAKPRPALNSTQLLYQMLLGEIAYARGDVGTALFSYNELLKRSDDPRLAARASEIGLTGALMSAQENPAEAEAALKTALARQPATRAAILRQLPAIFGDRTDHEKVAKIIERLTAPYLDLAEAHLARGIAELGAGHKDASHAAAKAALQINPDMEMAILLQAQTASPEQRTATMEELGAYGKSHPHALDVRVTYARWLAQEKRTEEARALYKQLLTEYPENDGLASAIVSISAQADDLDTTEALLTRLIEHGWGNVDRMQVLLGEVQEERGQTDTALQTLSRVGPGPQFVTAQLRKARILSARKDFTAAIQSLQESIERNPDDALVLQGAQAQLLRQNGQLKEAYALMQSVLVKDPNSQDLLYDVAMLEEQMGMTDLMEQHLRKLISLKANHAHALNALGYSYADRNIHLDEAADLLGKAIKLEPDEPAIQDSFGWLRFRQGRNADALEYLQRAYAKFPDPEVAGHLIEVLWSDGQRDAARKIMDQAIKANPESTALKALSARLGM